MRTSKLVVMAMGAALLGVTGVVGPALTGAGAAPATSPVPAVPPAPLEASRLGAEAGAAPATDAPRDALTRMRDLLHDGVPWASPQLDARLNHVLRIAERAVMSAQAHTTAESYARTWANAARTAQPFGAAGDHTDALLPPGTSALDRLYGFTDDTGASAPSGTSPSPGDAGAPVAPVAPAPQADAPTLPPPELDALLDAVESLDLARVLDALTDLLGGVLSTLTGAVTGITETLSGLTEVPTGDTDALSTRSDGAADTSRERDVPSLAQFPVFPGLPLMTGS